MQSLLYLPGQRTEENAQQIPPVLGVAEHQYVVCPQVPLLGLKNELFSLFSKLSRYQFSFLHSVFKPFTYYLQYFVRKLLKNRVVDLHRLWAPTQFQIYLITESIPMQYPEAMSFYTYHTSSKPYSINGSSSARNLELHKL